MKMKKIIALGLVAAVVCAGCSGKEEKTSEEKSNYEIVSEAISEVDETEAETSEETAVEETEFVPAEPEAEFSGDPDDRIVFEENTYYEAEKFFIFFGKGSEVRGDTIENLTAVMNDLEELFGMSYETCRVSPDDWRDSVFDGAFHGINEDMAKPNILIRPDPQDGTIEWAFENCCSLFDTDIDPDGEMYDIVYHEMAHLLRARQGGSLGSTFEEGVAVYAQYELSKKNEYPSWNMIQYIDFGDFKTMYDDSVIYADPEGEFIATTVAPRSGEQSDYQYGFRFITFLMEEYGPDIISKISENAYSRKLTNGQNDTDLLVEVIKDSTSEDVFTKFAEWLPSGWKNVAEEYHDFMTGMGYDL